MLLRRRWIAQLGHYGLSMRQRAIFVLDPAFDREDVLGVRLHAISEGGWNGIVLCGEWYVEKAAAQRARRALCRSC